jgi:hypothetical protein
MTDSPAPVPPEILAFAPVPTAPRHDGWTPDRQRRFVEALYHLGQVAAACRAVGLSPASAYKLRGRGDAGGFAAAWDLALEMGRDRVFERAMDRAMNGYVRPVRYRGEVVAMRHCFDNRLAYAIAFGERPRNPFKP